MIPTLPLGPRNRLAALILAALSDAGARRELGKLAGAVERALAGDWLGAGELRHAGAHDVARDLKECRDALIRLAGRVRNAN